MYSKETFGEIVHNFNKLHKVLQNYCTDRATLAKAEALLLAVDSCDDEQSEEIVKEAKELKQLAEKNVDIAEQIIKIRCETLFLLSEH